MEELLGLPGGCYCYLDNRILRGCRSIDPFIVVDLWSKKEFPFPSPLLWSIFLFSARVMEWQTYRT